MIINKSLFRFVPHKIRKIFNINVRLEIEGKTLVTPLIDGKALDAYWWHSWKTDAIKTLCRNDDGFFVDIGANVGQTLFDHFLAQTATNYIGFEPNAHCIDYLNEIIEANALTNYKILPVGLGNETSILPLYYRTGFSEDSAASLIGDLRPQWDLTSRYIACYKFDDICRSLNIQKIGLIKIDVEGFELEVLKGMRQTLENLRPIVLCEVLFADQGSSLTTTALRNEGIAELLDSLDYKILQLYKSLPDEKFILDVKKIEVFSNEFLTADNVHLYDYVFVPSSEEKRVTDLLINLKS